MMHRFFILVISIAMALGLAAEIVKPRATVPTIGNMSDMELVVTGIDFRPDLTRAMVKLKGRPHTGHRIDAFYLEGKQSTDVDGIDFERYFQFEDEGEILLEIDFPPMKPVKKHATIRMERRGRFNDVFGIKCGR